MAEMNEAEVEVRLYILQLLNEGVTPYEEIVFSVVDYFTGEYEEDLVTECAQRLVPLLYDARVEEQTMWPEETDCDRLDRVFTTLESMGVVARQDFTCCQTCGHSEIWDEMKEASKSREVIGYTFYHHQDLERMADSGSCYLAFGACEDNDELKKKVAELICQALKEEGFKVDWEGSLDKRILIRDVDWKKRLERRQ